MNWQECTVFSVFKTRELGKPILPHNLTLVAFNRAMSMTFQVENLFTTNNLHTWRELNIVPGSILEMNVHFDICSLLIEFGVLANHNSFCCRGIEFPHLKPFWVADEDALLHVRADAPTFILLHVDVSHVTVSATLVHTVDLTQS